jgi:hypothetical protein
MIKTQDGLNALNRAAANGHTQCVLFLLAGGADKNAKDHVRGMHLSLIIN